LELGERKKKNRENLKKKIYKCHICLIDIDYFNENLVTCMECENLCCDSCKPNEIDNKNYICIWCI
jgi:hypothetical protein